MENLNDKISILREEYELTQAEFGEKIGVSRGHVASLESGRYKPSKQLLNKIYKEFNIDEQVINLPLLTYIEEIKILNPEHRWLTYPSKKENELEDEINKQNEIIELLKDNNKMLKEKIKSLEFQISEYTIKDKSN